MRPIRLELEGFTAYRELTLCDFEGADIFVLTGPTGSGKSSIIDAITFALYGSVSRYGNPNLVHPVVSQGKVESKVRFDFSVEGRTYTAVRVVRRTKGGGATTREARLESDGRVLAGTAEELSRRVREILGLNFEQFTTCVVLPQGDFARFLHEKPAARQDLLTKLLGLDVYERMGSLARVRETGARERLRLHEDELSRLDATEATRKAAKRRLSDLERLRKEIELAEPELERLGKRIDGESAEAARLEREAALLEVLEAPRDSTRLVESLGSARRSLESAEERRAAAEESLAAAEKKSSALPDPWKLKDVERAHQKLARLREELQSAEADAQRAGETAAERDEENKRAEGAVEASQAALEAVRRELAAHDLASHLEVGRPCPVCLREVEKLPRAAMPPKLANAEKELSRADKARARARAAWQDASQKAALAAERRDRTKGEVQELEKKLRNEPSVEAIAGELQSIDAAGKEIARAREEAAAAREAGAQARKELERLGREERSAWKRYEEARDAVSSLKPPVSDREDLERAWSSLRSWAAEELPERRALAAKAAQSAKSAETERERRYAEIAARCRELGVDVARDRPRDGVVSALARAEGELERVERALERGSLLRTAIEKERESVRVAGALGQHLRASGFERWLLEESFRRLVSGASVILRELSSGQYSFEHDDRLNFEVVDHRNADERRSARTLSGGETFLASLALALTLADETAELAASGSARLESLFLDEGFGTLDDETLEVVASAIAELGARGRVVGVVTHQQNLAATIPVQYRVSKNPVTSTITKVVV